MKFFDKSGYCITKITVSPRNEGLSFASVIVVDRPNRHKPIPAVSNVLIPLDTTNMDEFRTRHLNRQGWNDVFVSDDLIYDEPVAQH